MKFVKPPKKTFLLISGLPTVIAKPTFLEVYVLPHATSVSCQPMSTKLIWIQFEAIRLGLANCTLGHLDELWFAFLES